MSQEKLQTMIICMILGVKEVYYWICASRECVDLISVVFYVTQRYINSPLKLSSSTFY